MIEKPVVYLIDDNEGVRNFLSIVFVKAGMDFETFACPSAFLAAYDPQRPSCLVLDLQLPEMSGLELWKELRRRGNIHPFILISGHGTISTTVEAMRQGAFDVLEKPLDHHRLIACIHEALEREVLVYHLRRNAADVTQRVSELTSRQREILELVVEGRLTKQIAKTLGISTKTVEVHRSNITKKMGVASVAQLVKVMTVHSVYSLSCVLDDGPDPTARINSRMLSLMS